MHTEANYTKCKYIVAKQQNNNIWNLYFAADDYQVAEDSFNEIIPDDRYKVAALFTRRQWFGELSPRLQKNMRDRSDEPIPSSIGMWVINQADSGYF